jgi:hypothetical protein
MEDTTFSLLPRWLLNFIESEVTSHVDLAQGDLLPPDEDWVTKALQGVNKGERNNVAAKLAGYYLSRGEPEPRVYELLRSWNLRNSEPLTDKELQTIVASISKKEARKRIRTDAVQGKTEPGAGTDKLSWEEQRLAGIQGLGERLGIPLTGITITHSDDSVVEFCLGEADSVMVPSGDLIEQRLFRKKFAAAGLLAPKRVTEPKGGGAWDEVFRQVVRLAVLQDAGEESSALGELREFINGYIESYRGLSYFSNTQTIPPHVPFFILHRKNEKPKLYTRAAGLFMEAKPLGFKSMKKLTVLLPSLGHEPEIFKWNRQTVRAWCMNLDGMSQDIKEMVLKKAMDGREKESANED